MKFNLITASLCFLLFSPFLEASLQEKIVYASNKNGDLDIWMINPDGTDPEILIDSQEELRAPKISPDGTKVAYYLRSNNVFYLYYFDLVTNTSHLVNSDSGGSIYEWWPDSNALLLSYPNGCSGDLMKFGLDGSASTLLTHPNQLRTWGVSSDLVIYYSINPCWSPSQSVHSYDTISGVTTLIQPSDGRAENSATLSDDGNWLLYSKAVASYPYPWHIYSMSVDGTGERRVVLSDPPATDAHPNFAPDSHRFVFERDIASDASVTELRIGDLTSGIDTVLLSDGLSNWQPNWGYLLISQDSDDDGVPDDEDICPGGDDNIDSDSDLVPDHCDPCPIDPANDADGDGVCGDSDVCPGGDDSADSDYDSTPDFCDVCPTDPENDADGDGICETDDNCEVIYNPEQTDTDEDSYGDACDPDNDNDGVPNEDDNCSFDANADQEDWDGDGIGDICDEDFDGDGVIDSGDQCLGTLPTDAVNEFGCSIAELCPCEHPSGGSKWKNHGAYVRCVAHSSEDFVAAGLIIEVEKDAIVSNAGQSECGHKK